MTYDILSMPWRKKFHTKGVLYPITITQYLCLCGKSHSDTSSYSATPLNIMTHRSSILRTLSSGKDKGNNISMKICVIYYNIALGNFIRHMLIDIVIVVSINTKVCIAHETLSIYLQ